MAKRSERARAESAAEWTSASMAMGRFGGASAKSGWSDTANQAARSMRRMKVGKKRLNERSVLVGFETARMAMVATSSPMLMGLCVISRGEV